MRIDEYRKQYESRCLVCGKEITGFKHKKYCSWSCTTRNKHHRLKNKYDDVPKELSPLEELIVSYIEKCDKDTVVPYSDVAEYVGISINDTITIITRIKAKGYLKDRY